MKTVSRSLTSIRNLLITQRSLRMFVRAAWTGLAGYLFVIGLTRLLGWQTPPAAGILAGLLVAMPSLIKALRPLTVDHLVWRMDRLLGLREQVTTAWQVENEIDEANDIESRLIEDMGHILPQTRKQIEEKGWYLKQDLLALSAVLLLLITLTAFDRISTPFPIPSAEAGSLPVLDQPPAFEDVFPSGIPGLTNVPSSESDPNPGMDGNEPSDGQTNEINNILSDLGDALSDHPETSEIGESLENGDLEGAAAAIERTADSVDLLPEDARQNMQQALQNAAAQASEANQDDLADNLERAAQALQNPDLTNPLAADALDELADEIRELGETFAAMGSPGEEDGRLPPENEPQVGSSGGAGGTGSGAGTQGESEPLSRLDGLGDDFTIQGGDSPSGLLKPGSAPGTSVTIEGGSINLSGSDSEDAAGTINSILTPYSYPWRWRDVVSEYFSP